MFKDNTKDDARLNAYGYTAAITGRTVNISAISRMFTIAYKLKKSDILEAISSHLSDC